MNISHVFAIIFAICFLIVVMVIPICYSFFIKLKATRTIGYGNIPKIIISAETPSEQSVDVDGSLVISFKRTGKIFKKITIVPDIIPMTEDIKDERSVVKKIWNKIIEKRTKNINANVDCEVNNAKGDDNEQK